MTITALLTAQSVGTSSNVGTGLYAAKLALQAATAGLVITAQLTAGAAQSVDPKQRLKVWFTTSPFDVSSGIVAQFDLDSKQVELNCPQGPSGVRVTTSEFVINQGGYLYYWVEVPTLAVAGSLNLSVVEI